MFDAYFAIGLPAWFRLLMVGVVALGTAFFVWALWSLGKNWAPSTYGRSDTSLETNGPYRIVRHPIYSGVIVFMVANAFLASNILIILFTIAILAVLYWETGKEEALLIARFGNEYREYMKRTPRFIPKMAVSREVGVQPSDPCLC